MDEAPPDETVAEIDRKTNYVIEHNELPSLRSRRHSLILLADRAIGRTPAAPRALQLVLLKMLTPLALRKRRGTGPRHLSIFNTLPKTLDIPMDIC